MTQWKVIIVEPQGIEIQDADPFQSKLSLSEDSSLFDTGEAKIKLRLGLFSYPVLQAADILLYRFV